MISVNLELIHSLWVPNIFIYNLKTFQVFTWSWSWCKHILRNFMDSLYQKSFKCFKDALSYFCFISNNHHRWSMFFQSSLDSGSIRLSASITGQLSNRLFSCFDFCLLRKVKRIKFFVYVYFIFSEGLILIDWASNLQLL